VNNGNHPRALTSSQEVSEAAQIVFAWRKL